MVLEYASEYRAGQDAGSQLCIPIFCRQPFLEYHTNSFCSSGNGTWKFNIYAYLSIYDVVAKLAVLYILYVSPGDKLIVYAALIMGVNMFTIVLYRIYCIRQFAECKFSLSVDKVLFRQMCSFSGWTTLGHLSAVLNQQGTTVLLNIFSTQPSTQPEDWLELCCRQSSNL